MNQDFWEKNPKLLQAFKEFENQLIEQIPTTEHEFSPTFELKMSRLIHGQRRRSNKRRVVLMLAATFILLITMVFSISALRKPVVRFFVNVYERFSVVFFISIEDESALPETLEIIFEPTWLPDGFDLEAGQVAEEFETFRLTHYFNDDELIKMRQFVIFLAALALDTEDIEAVEVMVGSYPGLSYYSKGVQNLIWNSDRYGFALEGPVSESDLLRIAMSLQEN